MTPGNNRKAFDDSKAEAFSEKLLTALNFGSLSLMISIGHRTGLFDAMKSLPSSTSEEVAKLSGLNERYVREWLGAMVTAGVVEVDPTSTKYTLPAEHAAFLTRAAGADNFAVFTQYIGLLGSVEDKIVECFKKGGGVPYDDFLRFHAVMAEDTVANRWFRLSSPMYFPSFPALPADSRRGSTLSISVAVVAEY